MAFEVECCRIGPFAPLPSLYKALANELTEKRLANFLASVRLPLLRLSVIAFRCVVLIAVMLLSSQRVPFVGCRQVMGKTSIPREAGM